MSTVNKNRFKCGKKDGLSFKIKEYYLYLLKISTSHAVVEHDNDKLI